MPVSLFVCLLEIPTSAPLTRLDAPTIFSIAGFDSMKSQWISGLNNVFYMVGQPEHRYNDMTDRNSLRPLSVSLRSIGLVVGGLCTGDPLRRVSPCSWPEASPDLPSMPERMEISLARTHLVLPQRRWSLFLHLSLELPG